MWSCPRSVVSARSVAGSALAVFGRLAAALLLWSLAGLSAAAADRQVVIALPGRAPVHLHVEAMGQGRPVLMLHGLGASSFAWRHVAPALARRHRVYLMDLKGFGRSSKPEDGRYALADQAALVKAWLLRRGLSGVAVVGHSLGGGVALTLALDVERTHPGLVSRLALVASPGFPQPLPVSIRALQNKLAVAAIALLPATMVMAASLPEGHPATGLIGFAEVAAYARPLTEPGALHALVQSAHQIVPPDFPRLARGYRTLRLPTLLVWCRDDATIPVEVGAKLSRTLPHARLDVLDGCGHMPMEEQPHQLARSLGRFLAPVNRE